MFGRRREMAHGRRLRAELAQALVHLQLAGAHAATGTARGAGVGAARLRGRLNASLAVFAPVVETAREEARRATRAAAKSKKSRKSKGSTMSRKWPYVLGAVAAGAAVGAGAYVVRKRRAERSAAAAVDSIARDAQRFVDSAAAAAVDALDVASGAPKDTWTKAKGSVSRDGQPAKLLEPTR